MRSAEDIIDSLTVRRKNKVFAWTERSGEVGEAFWETMQLAWERGVSLSAVIGKFQEDYDGPPGSDCTIRRAFKEWQNQKIS